MFHDIFSFFFCLFRIIIPKNYMDCSNCSTTCKCSSSCCCRMDKWIWVHHTLPYFFCRYKCGNRHYTTTERFCHRHDIWNNSPVVYSPEFPCTTKSSLHFISNEKDSMFLGRCTNTWPKIIRRNNRSCFALNWFHHDGSNSNSYSFTDLKLLLYSFCITKWNMINGSTIE